MWDVLLLWLLGAVCKRLGLRGERKAQRFMVVGTAGLALVAAEVRQGMCSRNPLVKLQLHV